jgi:hypothetical protein
MGSCREHAENQEKSCPRDWYWCIGQLKP